MLKVQQSSQERYQKRHRIKTVIKSKIILFILQFFLLGALAFSVQAAGKVGPAKEPSAAAKEAPSITVDITLQGFEASVKRIWMQQEVQYIDNVVYPVPKNSTPEFKAEMKVKRNAEVDEWTTTSANASLEKEMMDQWGKAFEVRGLFNQVIPTGVSVNSDFKANITYRANWGEIQDAIASIYSDPSFTIPEGASANLVKFYNHSMNDLRGQIADKTLDAMQNLGEWEVPGPIERELSQQPGYDAKLKDVHKAILKKLQQKFDAIGAYTIDSKESERVQRLKLDFNAQYERLGDLLKRADPAMSTEEFKALEEFTEAFQSVKSNVDTYATLKSKTSSSIASRIDRLGTAFTKLFTKTTASEKQRGALEETIERLSENLLVTDQILALRGEKLSFDRPEHETEIQLATDVHTILNNYNTALTGLKIPPADADMATISAAQRSVAELQTLKDSLKDAQDALHNYDPKSPTSLATSELGDSFADLRAAVDGMKDFEHTGSPITDSGVDLGSDFNALTHSRLSDFSGESSSDPGDYDSDGHDWVEPGVLEPLGEPHGTLGGGGVTRGGPGATGNSGGGSGGDPGNNAGDPNGSDPAHPIVGRIPPDEPDPGDPEGDDPDHDM